VTNTDVSSSVLGAIAKKISI